MDTRRPNLPALTGVRFFAALWVLCFHIAPRLDGSVGAFIGQGYDGVTLFFILSGFVLAYAYTTPGRTLRGTGPAFYLARVARLYPVYALLVVFAVVPYMAQFPGVPVGPRLLSSLLLMQTWVPLPLAQTGAIGPDGAAWSLSIEAAFYLIFPWILPACCRLSRRSLIVLVSAAAATPLTLSLLYAWVRPDGAANLQGFQGPGQWLFWFYYHPMAHLSQFVLGLGAGLLFLSAGRLPVRRVRIVLTVIVIAALGGSQSVPVLFLAHGVYDPLFALLIYDLAAVRYLPSMLVRLGDASYSLYLLHLPLAWYVARTLGDPHASWGVFAGYLMLAIAISLALVRYVEIPARRAILSARYRRTEDLPVMLHPTLRPS